MDGSLGIPPAVAAKPGHHRYPRVDPLAPGDRRGGAVGRAAVAALAPGRQEGRLADRRASEAGGAGSGRLTVGAGAAQQAEPAESARSAEASRSHGAGATA